MTITYRYISNSSLHIYILLHILHIVTLHYARAAQQGGPDSPRGPGPVDLEFSKEIMIPLNFHDQFGVLYRATSL